MDIRERIIKLLDVNQVSSLSYIYLKNSLTVSNYICGQSYPEIDSCGDEIDIWFLGCIESLFYKPNHYRLVLVGEQGIGKTQFFRSLLPDELKVFYSDSYEDIYRLFINCEDEFYLNVSSKKKLLNDGFKITDYPYFTFTEPSCNKRLVNYCATTNVWKAQKTRHNIVLNVESINKELYNSIDKLELWRELFFKFKPKTI
jgi:hypothetical protein